MNDSLLAVLRGAAGLRFLCSGNAVRSPFAELLARHLHCPLPVDSAATTYRNSTLFPETRAALLARDVDPAAIDGFRSRHMDDIHVVEPLAPDWVVIGMTLQHLEDARPRLPRHELVLLGDVIGAGEIEDPVMDAIPFERAFSAVEDCVRELIGRMAPS